MHITINSQKDDSKYYNVTPTTAQYHNNGGGFNPMAASCLETPTKNSERDDISKRNIPTFRVSQDK